MHANAFSIKETNILKGFGILLIIFHNFLHNLTPYVGENQFSYSFPVFENFYRMSLENPQEIFRTSLSYFGHYGVQLFVFFSAYGLTIKYWGKELKTVPFLKERFIKVYFSILFCLMIYIALGLVKSSFFPGEKILYWDSLLWKILLISNFIPGEAMMPVGPWWFISFIFQFYLFFPLLIKGFKNHGAAFLWLISLASIALEMVFNSSLVPHGINLNQQIIGHIPVLAAGMYFARSTNIEFRAFYVVSAVLLFMLSNLNGYLWVLSGLFFTLSTVWLAKGLFKNVFFSRYFCPILAFFGGISMHLFLVNGFLRSPFHHFAELHNLWWADILIASASVCFSTLFAVALRKSERYIRQIFTISSHAASNPDSNQL